ncbi:hypothetical protein [Puniceibacterium sp. IMCC21224]|uniref:hypothetical protein n=1 Tax=Puniceibacterium sp. IMCC21224 TaxID=1618204 RepID=UPI00064DCDFC|nr:hypothetical protein [Puniceibacterium sp. IMCC21224]KMK66306.1 hypothetical protein IMCC21224_111156 [Puniceibacterium sp. IMCC21224]
MAATLSVIAEVVRRDWSRLLLWGLVFALLSQVVMLIGLIARFGALPNYVTFYDWIGNVAWIVESTPSWSDIPPIIADEWLIEVGYMNYDYGTGISEWSLNVLPSRLMVLFGLGALISLCLRLARHGGCSVNARRSATVATGAGTVLVAMTNATMSWVVCCATPTWVVGLSMMGLGVSTSLALERLGPIFAFVGFGLLIATTLFLAVRRRAPQSLNMETTHA